MLEFNKLGAKIRWEQIEDGNIILDFIKKFNTLDTELKKTINSQNEVIETLSEKVDTLNKTIDNFGKSYKNEINTAVSDFQNGINELKKYCDDTFRRKDVKIGLGDLDDETTLLIDSILNAIEELQNNLDSIAYDYDRDGNYRKVLWTVYFEASTDKVVYLKDIDGFKEDMTRYITLEDFYGKNYANNVFNNPSVQVFCYGPTRSYITNYEAAAEDYLEKAAANVEKENIKANYVPRTAVDDNSLYPVNSIFESVGYIAETRAFEFEQVTTTDYLFKVVKFLDN